MSDTRDIHTILQSFQQGDFSARLPADLPDDRGQIARSVNALLDEFQQVAEDIQRTMKALDIKSPDMTNINLVSHLRAQMQSIILHQERLQTQLKQLTEETNHTRQRLYERRRQLHLIIASMSSMLLIVNEGMRVSAFFAPPGFPAVLDMNTVQIGTPVIDVLPNEFAHQVERALWLVSNYNRTSTFEHFIMLGGEDCYFEVTISPVTDSSDTLIEIRDVSEQRRTQLEVNQLKDDFVASVSHELRTPIYAIKGFLDLLNSGMVKDVETQQEFVNRAHEASVRLSALVSDLLDTTQLQSNRFHVDPAPCDICQVIDETVNAFSTLAQDKQIRLTTVCKGKHSTIQADSRRIQQVMTNLIGNAIKFTPTDGQIMLHLQSSEKSVRIEVIDQGPGIPEAYQEKLFTKFYQVDGAERRAGKGTGLGLYISRMIVEAHGGEIGVKSQAGRGSTFYFILPVAGPDRQLTFMES